MVQVAADAMAVAHGALVLGVFGLGLFVRGPWALVLLLLIMANQALDERGMCILTRWENRLRGLPEESGQGFVYGLVSRVVSASPEEVYGVLTALYMVVCAAALWRTNNKMYQHFAVYWLVMVVVLQWARPRVIMQKERDAISNPKLVLVSVFVAALLAATNRALQQ